jgi:hypothetical protein
VIHYGPGWFGLDGSDACIIWTRSEAVHFRPIPFMAYFLKSAVRYVLQISYDVMPNYRQRRIRYTPKQATGRYGWFPRREYQGRHENENQAVTIRKVELIGQENFQVSGAYSIGSALPSYSSYPCFLARSRDLPSSSLRHPDIPSPDQHPVDQPS